MAAIRSWVLPQFADLAGQSPRVLTAQRSVAAASQRSSPGRGARLDETRYRCLAAISYQSRYAEFGRASPELRCAVKQNQRD